MSKINQALIGLKPYGDKRIVGTFGLGMAAGFPLTFVVALLGTWLSRMDVDTSDVGLFALLTTFYTWKFVWSPAIDRIPLGPISRRFGQRRGWLLLIQALMAIAFFVVANLDPKTQLLSVAIVAAIIAFLSASQDIVIDAYRIEILEDDDQGYSAASYVYGYRTANFIAGIGITGAAFYFGWNFALHFLPILFIPAVLAVWWIGEPERSKAGDFLAQEQKKQTSSTFKTHFREAVILPFKEFARRPNWLLILLFIFLFKAGDAVTSIMTAPLLVKGMGYSDLDIALANKFAGFIALMVGIGLGAVLYKIIGMYRALFLTGILMMVTNLGFAWLASGDAENWRLATTIGMENFATGLGTTVTIAYMAGLCNANFTATQYALLSSLASQARTLLGAPSGYVAEYLGWFEFFVGATLLAIPGLFVLWLLWRKDVARLKEQPAG